MTPTPKTGDIVNFYRDESNQLPSSKPRISPNQMFLSDKSRETHFSILEQQQKTITHIKNASRVRHKK